MGTRLSQSSSGSSIGTISIVAGLVGAVATAFLWVHEISPDSPLVDFVTERVLEGTDGWTALVTVAAVSGGLGLLVTVLGSIGTREKSGGAIFGGILCLAALTYPFAYLAQIVSKPFEGGGSLIG